MLGSYCYTANREAAFGRTKSKLQKRVSVKDPAIANKGIVVF